MSCFAESGFYPAQSSCYTLFSLFAEYYWSQYALTAFVDTARPEKIVFSCGPVEHPTLQLEDGRQVISRLLPAIAKVRKVEIEELPPLAVNSLQRDPGSTTSGLFRSVKNAAFAWLHQTGVGLELLCGRNVGARQWLRSIIRPQFSPPAGRILVLGGGYDIDPLTTALRESNLRISRVPILLQGEGRRAARSSVSERMRSIWHKAAEDGRFWAPFSKFGLSYDSRVAAPFEY